jgi:hypothetical protein
VLGNHSTYPSIADFWVEFLKTNLNEDKLMKSIVLAISQSGTAAQQSLDVFLMKSDLKQKQNKAKLIKAGFFSLKKCQNKKIFAALNFKSFNVPLSMRKHYY